MPLTLFRPKKPLTLGENLTRRLSLRREGCPPSLVVSDKVSGIAHGFFGGRLWRPLTL